MDGDIWAICVLLICTVNSDSPILVKWLDERGCQPSEL